MIWTAAAALVGFLVSFVLAGLLELPRNALVLGYAVVAALFLHAFVRASGFDVRGHFRQRIPAGLLGAAIAGALVIANVLSQPGSVRPEGTPLVIAVLWVGVVYGVLDALLLSVMPVVAVTHALSRSSRILTFVLALAASLLVTAAYHLGYPEFRGPQVAGPLIGNAILTLAYLLNRSPWSTTLAHVAMHVASVLHGMETTVQLPPHY